MMRAELQNLQGKITPPEPPLTTNQKVWRVIGNIFFYLTIIVVVLGVALFGFQDADARPREILNHSVMTVLSSSMEPTLPVRTLIVTRVVDPNTLEVGDIITHLLPNNTTRTHRIIEIHENHLGSGMRGFRLLGDNNSLPDRDIVLDHNLVGLVVFDSLILGQIVFFIQRNIILVVVFVALLFALVYVLKKFFLAPTDLENDEQSKEQPQPVPTVTPVATVEQEAPPAKKKGAKIIKTVVIVLLLGLFAYSAYRVIMYQLLYRDIEAAGEDLRNEHLQTITIDEAENEDSRLPHRDFLVVDWDGLLARNQDVVAWLHIPGSAVNYPVLAGATNEEYLRLNIDREHSVAGSIFLEENNANNFTDLNTIIYGHNMLNGSKFSTVQSFIEGTIRVEDVPYIFVYLPDGQVWVYQIFGAHLTDIHSQVYHLPVTDLAAFHELIDATNRLDIDFEIDLDARVLTLSTCSEIGGTPIRSIIFGMLIEQRVITQ